jgi:carboxyl-terminal processing protease
MPESVSPRPALVRGLALLLAGLVLAGCGGGGAPAREPVAASCEVAELKSWLRGVMNRNYLYTDISPKPAPDGFETVADYFEALLYPGGADFPRDRFSGSESTARFQRFYGEGRSMGYGLAVAGLEIAGRPEAPLYVRHVEPGSPAGRLGVRRGDQVLSLDGRSAADLVAADDFALLVAEREGQTLTLQLRSPAGTERTVVLTSEVFSLTPVPRRDVLVTEGGRKVGYVIVKDMINAGAADLQQAFTRFAGEGVQDVVLDLRYNGGGLVSFGALVASYVAGPRGLGRDAAVLRYNAQLAPTRNTAVPFQNVSAGLGLPRAYVLAGRRTCSASEQVVSALRGVGIEAVLVGETTCGKPVGSNPVSDGCGLTYSIINFESVNARGEGRWFDGFAPACAVPEDFTSPLGVASEPLLGAALVHADTGQCPAVAAAEAQRRQALAAPARRRPPSAPEPGERRDMLAPF